LCFCTHICFLSYFAPPQEVGQSLAPPLEKTEMTPLLIFQYDVYIRQDMLFPSSQMIEYCSDMVLKIISISFTTIHFASFQGCHALHLSPFMFPRWSLRQHCAVCSCACGVQVSLQYSNYGEGGGGSPHYLSSSQPL